MIILLSSFFLLFKWLCVVLHPPDSLLTDHLHISVTGGPMFMPLCFWHLHLVVFVTCIITFFFFLPESNLDTLKCVFLFFWKTSEIHTSHLVAGHPQDSSAARSSARESWRLGCINSFTHQKPCFSTEVVFVIHINQSAGASPSSNFCGCIFQSNAIRGAEYFLVRLMRSTRNGDKPSCKQVYDPEQIFEQRQARWLLFLINSLIVSINVLLPHCVINQESDCDHLGKS